MSITLAQTRPTTLSTILPVFAVPLLFSLFGLALSAAILPYLSDETISMMFSSIGFG